MSRRSFAILVAIIVVLGALVALNRPAQQDPGGEALLPGLDAALNDIERITIRGAGGQTLVTLERGESRWTVAELDGYPADVGRLRRNLIASAEATLVESKTAEPARYERLGVEDVAADSATGHEFTLEAGEQTWSVIVGKTGVRGSYAYARLPDEAQSWLIDADLDPGGDAAGWADPVLLEIPPAEIARITTVHPDNHVLRLRNTEDRGFEPVDVPADAQVDPTGVATSIGAVLSDLRLTGVQRPPEADAETATPVETRFETVDGLDIITRVYTADNRRFVAFEFAAREDAQAESAASQNARLGGWWFRIPDYKLDLLTKRREDVFTISGGGPVPAG